MGRASVAQKQAAGARFDGARVAMRCDAMRCAQHETEDLGLGREGKGLRGGGSAPQGQPWPLRCMSIWSGAWARQAWREALTSDRRILDETAARQTAAGARARQCSAVQSAVYTVVQCRPTAARRRPHGWPPRTATSARRGVARRGEASVQRAARQGGATVMGADERWFASVPSRFESGWVGAGCV
jgi:hypothetical protein